jgi:tRNA (mo5U34)-methyltransferase
LPSDAGAAGTCGSLPWFHQLDLGGGVITPGVTSNAVLQAQADEYFKGGIGGLSVLDLGCWDGFNSFEAKRRGATRVLATDRFAWRNGPGSRESFELAREQLGLEVEMFEIDVDDLSPTTLGNFDLCCSADCSTIYATRSPAWGGSPPYVPESWWSKRILTR